MSELSWTLNETPISSSKANKLGVPKWTTATRDAKADADLFVGMVIYNVTTGKLQKLRQLTPSRIWVDLVDVDDKNVASGVAGLDSGAKVPLAQLDEVLSLDDLLDTMITSPANDEALVYESASGKWKNKASQGGFYAELGRTKLTSAATSITVSGLPAKKFLQILVFWRVTSVIANPDDVRIRFNNDSASNYAERWSVNGGAQNNADPQTSIIIARMPDPGSNGTVGMAVVDIVNITSYQKPVSARGYHNYIQSITIAGGVWRNTTAQINRVDVLSGGNFDFNTDSEVVVLGHD